MKTLTVTITVPDEQYQKALTVFDALEYCFKHREPSVLYIGVPLLQNATVHVIGEETRPEITDANISSFLTRPNAQLVFLKQ